MKDNSMTEPQWRDIRDVKPPNGARVIVLMPFGMRIRDDTWVEPAGWLNSRSYVSHWMPASFPGTSKQIIDEHEAIKQIIG